MVYLTTSTPKCICLLYFSLLKFSLIFIFHSLKYPFALTSIVDLFPKEKSSQSGFSQWKKNGSISPSAYVQLSCENEIDMLISLSFHLILFFKKNWCLLMSRCIFHIKHLSHVFTKNGCFPLQQAKSIWCVWNPWKMGFDLSTHLLQKIQTIKY